jgi:phosphoribosylformylglycinamidine cyclo-ligase
MTEPLSYKDAGVDIENADATKRAMAAALETTNRRVLNKIGAFASLFDASFPEMKHPVLVLKTEEPGSKQKLAFQHGRVRSICFDMINHLVNDIIVMGATPLSVQDAVICGKLEKPIVNEIVAAIAAACKAQECVLTGGETSEQPGVIEPGTYILSSSIIGVVEKEHIIDGASIAENDVVIAVESSGLHTNGYSLVRALMARDPSLAASRVGDRSFLDTILEPHRCYYDAVKGLFRHPGLHGMAHITGGGIGGNLDRILPPTLDASIDLTAIAPPPVFGVIQRHGNVTREDMLRTFNCGVGLTVVAAPHAAPEIVAHLNRFYPAYPIGRILPGGKQVRFTGAMRFEP